ncbi:MAG: hypothetical protein IT376_09265 [Polyangiaceae bacterium]|nr:hypothetical protein [Polyangiaceae bacterium]
MRTSPLLAVALLTGLLAPLPWTLDPAHADGVATRPDVLPVSEVKPGMKGYGLTVFEGTRPEKFDVEVIGVLKTFAPKQELILVKTTHPRLEIVKVVAGMSGSPIFLNGKMAGAYAYGWGFGKEPVAGVTPIRNMLDDMDRPLPKQLDGFPITLLPKGKADRRFARAESHGRWRGRLTDYDPKEHATQLAAARKQSGPDVSSPFAPVATPLLVGGFSASAVELARQHLAPLGLEPLQAGGGDGSTEDDAPKRYVDGGAVGVQLIRGDMSATGLGTVTKVEGDRLVGFGHPMMQAGYTLMPTAVGRILWFLASDARSFKIGYPVRNVGAMIGDRQSSIVVSHSAQAPVVPIKLKVKGVPGAPYTEWSFEVAHEKFMAPIFMAIALGSALTTTASERMDVSWTSHSKLRVKGHGEIALEDFGVAVGGTPEAGEMFRTSLIRNVGMLLNNPWEPAIIESAEMEIEFRYAREILRIKSVESLDPELEPGEPARLRITFVPWNGKEFTKTVEVPLGKDLAGQMVSLAVQPGYMHYPDLPQPDDVAQLVKNMGAKPFPPQSVIVSHSRGEAGVTYKQRVVRNLPPGAVDALRPSTGAEGPIGFTPLERTIVPMPAFVIGWGGAQVRVRPVVK